MSRFSDRSTGAARARRTSGISMIEVMIALTILGFGMLTMAAAQLSSLQFTGESRNRSEAHNLAQQQMESFQTMTKAALDAAIVAPPADPGNPLDPDPLDAHVVGFNRSWLITADAPEPGVYTVNVSVNWNDNLGQVRLVQIEGLKAAF